MIPADVPGAAEPTSKRMSQWTVCRACKDYLRHHTLKHCNACRQRGFRGDHEFSPEVERKDGC